MNNKDEFIRIDCYHYFRKDDIIGFKSIGGDDGEPDEICKGDDDSYIEFYFKNGTSQLVSFGFNCKEGNKWRNAYITYLKEVFSPNQQEQTDRLNEIIEEQNPEDYRNVDFRIAEEEITQRDIDGFNADPVEFEEAFENNTIERGNNV